MHVGQVVDLSIRNNVQVAKLPDDSFTTYES